IPRAGIASFAIFARAEEIGGTWRDTTYPGAACDVPSHVYCFSFEPHPGWTRVFAGSEEIQAYLLRVVEKWGLRRFLRLGVEIVEGRFDEAAGAWTLATRGGERVRARAVVSGVGGLVAPGPGAFGGAPLHGAGGTPAVGRAARRVGVIGPGASAVQVGPATAPRVAPLAFFQRTPAWVMPKRDRLYSERARRFFARHPAA